MVNNLEYNPKLWCSFARLRYLGNTYYLPTTKMKHSFLQLHFAIFLAGFTGVLGRIISLSEGYLVLYRLILSALIIWIYLLYQKRPIVIPKVNTLKLLGIGGIIAMHWLAFYGSIKYSNISVSVTCLSAIGFFTAFMEPLITGRRLDWVEAGLGILAILGVMLIFNFYPEFKLGIVFGVIAALLGSIFPILNKPVLRKFSPMTVNLYEMSGGALVLAIVLPFYLYFFPSNHYLPTTWDVFWLVILALFCTVIAFDFGLKALNKLPTFTVNLSFNFEPVYSIIMAFIIFKENEFLGPHFYEGFALILSAVTLQMIRTRNRAKRRLRVQVRG